MALLAAAPFPLLKLIKGDSVLIGHAWIAKPVLLLPRKCGPPDQYCAPIGAGQPESGSGKLKSVTAECDVPDRYSGNLKNEELASRIGIPDSDCSLLAPCHDALAIGTEDGTMYSGTMSS